MKNIARKIVIVGCTVVVGFVTLILLLQFTMGQSMTSGEVARMALPNCLFPKPRPQASKTCCIAHLKQMDGAKATWALENKKSSTDIPTDSDLFGQTLYIRDKPICPQGGIYTFGDVSTKVSCSLAARGHTL